MAVCVVSLLLFRVPMAMLCHPLHKLSWFMYWYIGSKKSIFWTREEGSATWVAIYCQKNGGKTKYVSKWLQSIEKWIEIITTKHFFSKFKENNENDIAVWCFQLLGRCWVQTMPITDLMGQAAAANHLFCSELTHPAQCLHNIWMVPASWYNAFAILK